MNPKTMDSTDPSLSTSHVDKDYQTLEQEAAIITNTIGDDPDKSKEVLQKQAEADKLKLEAANKKAIQESIEHNMGKQRDAFADTMYEVMHGHPRSKTKESDK
jgi:hypothetical protein